jgi:nuclear GTP-binding protein
MNNKFEKAKKGGKSRASTNPDRKLPEKQLNGPQKFMRSKATINRLRMQKEKPDYDKMWEQSKEPARIDPNRKWFGNIRTID